MKADLSRQTFDPQKRYSGVLMQQGRVLLDSEWNEQQEIQQHRTESGTEGVIGPSGTPIGEDGTATGFEITARDGKLFIDEGHIYVDGTLCVNEREVSYEAKPDAGGQPNPPNPDDLTGWMEDSGSELRLGLVYLDVWERHVTHLDDERIREVALGGPDTTTRKQTVWQVKVRKFDLKNDAKEDLDLLTRYAELQDKSNPTENESEELRKISPRAVEMLDGLCERGEKALDELREPPTGKLTARTKEPTGTTGPCQIPRAADTSAWRTNSTALRCTGRGIGTRPASSGRATTRLSSPASRAWTSRGRRSPSKTPAATRSRASPTVSGSR
jgi:hypothetical protein